MRQGACAKHVGILTTEHTLARRFKVQYLAHLEERLLPSPQYAFRQDRELVSVRVSSITVGVVYIVILDVEFQEITIAFLQVLVELGVFFSQLGQFQHMCSTLVYAVQILSTLGETFFTVTHHRVCPWTQTTYARHRPCRRRNLRLRLLYPGPHHLVLQPKRVLSPGLTEIPGSNSRPHPPP